MPEWLAVVTEVTVARNGDLWIGTNSGESLRWYVVGARGAVLNEVEVPDGVRVVWVGDEVALGLKRRGPFEVLLEYRVLRADAEESEWRP